MRGRAGEDAPCAKVGELARSCQDCSVSGGTTGSTSGVGSRGLERRLFRWFLALALAPALLLIGVGAWLWAGWLGLLATTEPWAQVAESGRLVLEAAASAAETDPELGAALARHRDELSGSLLLANRWAYVGQRLSAVTPLLAAMLALTLAAVAFLASRRLARELTRPVHDLVGWTERIAREEPLPAPGPGESRELSEIRALRAALRRASVVLPEARRRAVESERVRAWGELARRVAHEMKNPLTPLRLAVHRLESAGQDEAGLAEAAAIIRDETARLEDLAARFASLGRPPEGPASEVDLGELLRGTLATDLPAGAGELDLPSRLPYVEGHYEALVRVFRNLLRNAVEAAPDGVAPRVLISARSEEDGDGRVWVEVRVADNGPGLPEGVGQRVFEPDFTTKSGGAGLGLAIARQTVQAHGGRIDVGPGPVGGAEFRVRLPATGSGGQMSRAGDGSVSARASKKGRGLLS